jgi:hypothetical protein
MVCWWLAVIAVLVSLGKCDTSNENTLLPAKVARYDR